MSWLILLHEGKPYPGPRYPQVVEEDERRPGHYTAWSGIIGTSGTLLAGYSVRPPRNAAERTAVATAEAAHRRETAGSFSRWARRHGCVVEWGNNVVAAGAVFSGQSFRETFASEAEAIERERQALAKEDIGAERAPIAIARDILHP
jgi:hypothetical protein